MRRPGWIALILALAMGAPARAQEAPPYTAGWGDVASAGVAGALFIVPGALKLPEGAPPCAPCDPSGLWGIDRSTLGAPASGAGTASNVALVADVGLAGLAALDGQRGDAARGNEAVMVNSLAWAAATSEWLKVAVHRSRPVLYTAGAAAAAGDPDSRRSLPSGHATFAFAAATTYLVLARREHLAHATRNAVLLYAGAIGVAALRVAAHRHFPTDVAAGAALGIGVGWVVPRLHPIRF
ncbi:MAG TPA: phosphatase PAP2 family protein [Gemmatimonadales bacterium]|nr:phosphatase PAP2 family protein [Gemmatimonadales bacterium]